MLRRRPGSLRPPDPVDQELIEGVEAEFPWHVLVKSASCAPDEAEQRLYRLLRAGFLEGTPGDTRAASKTSLPPVQVPVAREVGPAPSGNSGMPSRMPGPSGEALLRELRALRGQNSIPPVEVTRRPPPGVVSQSRPPVSTSSHPPLGMSSPPASSWAPSAPSSSSNPPPTYSRAPSSASLPPVGSVPPGGPRCDVDSPLGLLIDELSRGQGMQRWSAARLREALEEELAGNFLQAVAILQVVLAQMEDPRIRAERMRLQDKSQRAASGIYRSQAIDAEKQRKHSEAAEHWRKVVEANPTDADAALHAAKNFIEAGDLKQAAHHARRATQLAPNNINAHKVLLHFFKRSGMEASAQREREILAKLRGA